MSGNCPRPPFARWHAAALSDAIVESIHARRLSRRSFSDCGSAALVSTVGSTSATGVTEFAVPMFMKWVGLPTLIVVVPQGNVPLRVRPGIKQVVPALVTIIVVIVSFVIAGVT